MEFALDTLTEDAVYRLMVQVIVPRPIAWVISDSGEEHGAERWNLAPFSYFNGVSERPPLVMLGFAPRDAGGAKDTLRNLRERRYATIHIAAARLADVLVASSRPEPYGVSELRKLGLDCVPFDGHPLPRLAVAPIAMAAETHEIVALDAEGEFHLALLRLRRIHVSDDVLGADRRGRPAVDPRRLDPLMRLGGIGYGTLGSTREIPFPGVSTDAEGAA